MTLSDMIARFEDVFHVHVCVHDVSGITNYNSKLYLEYSRKSHSCEYCTQVKELMSASTCMRQKQIVMRRLRILKGQPFFGTCYMGVSEYILPVMRGNRLLCVIFVSGASREDLPTAAAKRRHTLSDELKDALQNEYAAFCGQRATTRSILKLLAELLADTILENSSNMIAEANGGHDGRTAWQVITPVNSQIRNSWLTTDLLPYIQENYRSKLSLRMLSDMFFITPEYLCRIFSRQMGSTMTKYVNQLRLRHASIQLTSTSKSIAQIAMDVGIDDVNYFYRLFKAQYGMTARAYREKYAESRHPAKAPI